MLVKKKMLTLKRKSTSDRMYRKRGFVGVTLILFEILNSHMAGNV